MDGYWREAWVWTRWWVLEQGVCLFGLSWAFRMARAPIKQLQSIPVDYQLVLSTDQLYAVVDGAYLVHYCIWATPTARKFLASSWLDCRGIQ